MKNVAYYVHWKTKYVRVKLTQTDYSFVDTVLRSVSVTCMYSEKLFKF